MYCLGYKCNHQEQIKWINSESGQNKLCAGIFTENTFVHTLYFDHGFSSLIYYEDLPFSPPFQLQVFFLSIFKKQTGNKSQNKNKGKALNTHTHSCMHVKKLPNNEVWYKKILQNAGHGICPYM